MSIAQVHAQQVCEYLENDKPSLFRCLSALKDGEEGQLALKRGESQVALEYLLKAEADFDTLPQATFLLGITKADIAAAYGNLQKWSKAAKYACAAIEIAKHDQAFAETEANAHMTLAGALGTTGDIKGAETHLEIAEQIYKRLPDTGPQLIALKQNRRILSKHNPKSRRPWWKFWE